LSPEYYKDFLNEASLLINKELNVDFIAKPQSNAVFKSYPDNAFAVEWGSYQKKINVSEEALMLSINSKTRNMIRRGMKEGIIIEMGTIDELYHLLKDTFARQKEMLLAPNYEYLEKLKNKLGSNFVILKCSLGDKIQGIVGVPFDSKMGYYLYGGMISKPVPGAMNLLQFETMKFLAERGIEKYDFVGARIHPNKNSKYYGIQKFKESFNPDLKVGYSFKVIYNKTKYQLFNILVWIAYKLKGGTYNGDSLDQIKKESRNA
jgi:lipid II:glycine glycyltransferase (peptidoglycan interpeptide bridge formation enzyme)